MSLMSASLGKFKKALVLTQSAALSPMNAMQRSMNEDALLPPSNGEEKHAELVVLLHIYNRQNKVDITCFINSR